MLLSENKNAAAAVPAPGLTPDFTSVDDTDADPVLAGLLPALRRPHQVYVQRQQQQLQQQQQEQQKQEPVQVVTDVTPTAADELAEILALDPEYELR